MGVNLGLQDFNGAANFMQNMFDNPGFEPSTDGHLIKVGAGATEQFFHRYYRSVARLPVIGLGPI